MQANPSTGNPAVRQGIIVGVGLAIISIIVNSIIVFGHLKALSVIIGVVIFIIELLAYGYAGFRASSITGRVGTGAIAGLIAGLVASVIGIVYSLILIFTGLEPLQTSGKISYSAVVAITIVGLILGLAIAIGIGAGLGAIGGVIGRGRAPQTQQYQESMYQGMPPQGPYQGVPPTPGQYPSPNQGQYSQNPNQYQQNPGSYSQAPYSNAPQNPPASNDNPSNPY